MMAINYRTALAAAVIFHLILIAPLILSLHEAKLLAAFLPACLVQLLMSCLSLPAAVAWT